MKLQIRHRTVYRYLAAPRRSVQALHLTPKGTAHQTVLSWAVHTSMPAQAHEDAWGNTVHLVACDWPARQLVCEAQGEVETHGCPNTAEPGGPPPGWYAVDSPLSSANDALRRWSELVWAPPANGRIDGVAALALADAVADTVSYTRGATDAHTTAAQAFELGRGVCQDQAHVYIAACRAVGVAARYVSGYFHSGDRPASGDAELASHAWAEICTDAATRRWLAVDVTHRCLIDERHVRLAVGPDYASCAPVMGVVSGGSGETLTAEVTIGERRA